MIVRDKIKQQLTKTNLLVLACVLVFSFSLVATAITDVSGFLIAGAIASGSGLVFVLSRVSPKCPFCDSNVVSRGDRIGNYCNDCGNSFDKKIP